MLINISRGEKTIGLKINYKVCIYIMVAFFMGRFFNIQLIRENMQLTFLYSNISRIIFLGLFINWIRIKKNKKDYELFILLLIYYLVLLISTLTNNGSIWVLFSDIYPVLGTFFFISAESKFRYKTLLRSYYFLLYFLVLVNFVDMILFKDLSSEYSTNFYFLGGKNQLGICLSIGFSFVGLYTQCYNNLFHKLLKWVYILIIITTAVLTKSGTSIITIFILLIGTMLLNDKYIAPGKFFLSYLFFLYSVIKLKIQNYFKFIIVDILHKDITFTNRTKIWDVALKQISNKFVLGHGMHSNRNYFTVSLRYGDFSFSAHNEFLQQLYEGGVLSVTLFCMIFFICCFYSQNKALCQYFFWTLVAIFITWFAEAPGMYGMFLMLFFNFYLIKLKKVERKIK